MAESTRQKLDRRIGELRTERSTWETQWRDICDQILPYRAIWSKSDSRKGKPKDTRVINSTPVRALRVLAAGLMAGITSPSRKWFNFTTRDKNLAGKKVVREYLSQAELVVREMLLIGGFYRALATGIYPDLGMIGTAACFQDEDEERHMRFEPLVIGKYWLDTDKNGNVDTCYREIEKTVRQVVEDYGIDKVSSQVRNSYQKGDLGREVVLYHAVYPNTDYDGKLDSASKAWSSDWWEKGSPHAAGFLRERGYDEFPVLAPRWNPRGLEAYGRGAPGWEARGDCKALQHLELRLARLVDKSSDPPMKGHNSLRSARASLLPGDMTYMPANAVFEPAMQVNPQSIAVLQQHIERHENRVEEAFFVDLWLAMLADDRAQRPTATEVEARRTEVMLQLGPLLENLDDDLLEPVVERTFQIAQRRGMLPPPPPELQETNGAVSVEFISIMHQAQKSTGISSIRELVFQVGTLGQAKPEALDKLNVDAIVDELTETLGVKPELVLSNEEVAAIREAQQRQAQAQQQGEAMLAATEGIKNLGQADPQNVQDIASQLAPAAAAQGGQF